MLTLWGRKNSCNVQKALWALSELELNYRHIPLGGAFHGLDDPDYLKLNPNGQVPTLQDGALVVWESHAIIRYLAAAYEHGSLWPIEPRARAIVDQWTDWAATSFQPSWISLFWNVVRTPEGEHDRDLIHALVVKTNALLGILDLQLVGNDYIAGNFSYADIAIGVAMYRWFTMDIARETQPNVERWYQNLLARPAFVETVAVSYAELVGRKVF